MGATLYDGGGSSPVCIVSKNDCNSLSALACIAPTHGRTLVNGSRPIEQRGSDFRVTRRGSAITSPRPASADVALAIVAATVLGRHRRVFLADDGAGTAPMFMYTCRQKTTFSGPWRRISIVCMDIAIR